MLRRLLGRRKQQKCTKQDAELGFWRREIVRYQQWLTGELKILYKSPCPTEEQWVGAQNLKDSSVLTWHRVHQEAKYLSDLDLAPGVFEGMKVLDVGSGPMPSATCFTGCRIFCLEPLLPKYVEAGFPLHYYDRTVFIHGSSEQIPIEDDFFDAVISVNAIDHVDSIKRAAAEIQRVLRDDGLFRMHVHYHPPTRCEPITIDDALFQGLFGWCKNLKKIKSTRGNFSQDLPDDESFALWSNF